jgi:glutathione synthase/RimK-type ligase-like ATP-grasp enzyme
MMRVALATCASVPDLTEDDRLLLDELSRRGVTAGPVVWNDAGVRWSTFDRIVIRSCWDYHLRLSEFLAWLDRVEAEGVPLWNPAPLVRFNAHKSYLKELKAAGLPVVPTAWLERGSTLDLGRLLQERGWSEAVVKPAVSASAFRTWRVSAQDAGSGDANRAFRELIAESDVLVQPFLREIAQEGEWSFVFLGGEFSHAVLKRPAAGDFRVQAEYGGSVLTEPPPSSAISEAKAVALYFQGPWAYARIDAVLAEGALTLMEVELIEPYLFLGSDPRAAVRLADAVLRPVSREPGA